MTQKHTYTQKPHKKQSIKKPTGSHTDPTIHASASFFCCTVHDVVCGILKKLFGDSGRATKHGVRGLGLGWVRVRVRARVRVRFRVGVRVGVRFRVRQQLHTWTHARTHRNTRSSHTGTTYAVVDFPSLYLSLRAANLSPPLLFMVLDIRGTSPKPFMCTRSQPRHRNPNRNCDTRPSLTYPSHYYHKPQPPKPHTAQPTATRPAPNCTCDSSTQTGPTDGPG